MLDFSFEVVKSSFGIKFWQRKKKLQEFLVQTPPKKISDSNDWIKFLIECNNSIDIHFVVCTELPDLLQDDLLGYNFFLSSFLAHETLLL
jgi:hypothetical protein